MTFPPLPTSTTLATVRSEPPPGPPFGLAGLTGLTGLEGPLLAALGLGLLLGAHRHVAPNCRPDQILVIAGRGRRRGDGQRIGYRVVHGGRALMVPWLEHRRWMDVRTRAVPIRVAKAYAQGGTPIDVEAIATVKISTDPACVGNAIERFLGHEPAAVQEVAARSLEGHLRVMVAGMTPEQVNQDRLRFADRVLEVTRPDMIKLGLQVDTFKIQRLSDTVDYLLQALRPEGRRHGLQPTQGEEHGGGGIERGQDTAPSSQAAARRSPRNWRVVVPEEGWRGPAGTSRAAATPHTPAAAAPKEGGSAPAAAAGDRPLRWGSPPPTPAARASRQPWRRSASRWRSPGPGGAPPSRCASAGKGRNPSRGWGPAQGGWAPADLPMGAA